MDATSVRIQGQLPRERAPASDQAEAPETFVAPAFRGFAV